MQLKSVCMQPLERFTKTLSTRCYLMKSDSTVLPHSPPIDSSGHSKRKDWHDDGEDGEGRIVYGAFCLCCI